MEKPKLFINKASNTNMLDINLIRNHPEKIKEDLQKRKDKEAITKLEDLIKTDKQWRDLKKEEDTIRQERNEISKKINKEKKAGNNAKKLIAKAKKIPKKLDEVQKQREKTEDKRKKLLWSLPNLTHETVPYGKDDTENKEIKTWGEKTKEKPKHPHQDILEKLNQADFERSAKISGAGFYILKGDIALLNQALIRFAIDQLIRKGYEYQEPPLLLNKEAYETGVSLEDFEDVMYKIDGEDKYLIATSEHPLLSQFKDDTFKEDQLPIKIAGYSMNFRKEVGSHGIDTKGIWRTHQFNKVEQIVVCKPEDSWKIHEEMQRNVEKIHEMLELPYRVVNVCTGDLGGFAAKKYDVEVWRPRSQDYGETSSCSNYTDYQARRANIRYHFEQDNEYLHVHTLNGTAIATGRILVAIIENHLNDGNIIIPKVLRPYMYGKDKITLQQD